ncbi:protein TolR [Thiohalobacter sp. COW1]|uniref:protein TolR n=1 Tax=Thiohalobacter sp. COW1 TaxID=2795687 RepID=UPI001938B4EE|nr:protein TolR [Thiohalobacter sp. COW1]BCO31463.1 protein TolR [Thiohalobacter sp. COW1]
MARQRHKKRPMAEINVVPYIDVMLVMLVIFMITAPLLTQGVHVSLPSADAQPLPQDSEEPLQVTVDAGGNFYLNVGDDPDQPIDAETLVQRSAAVLRNKPNTPVLVRGDAGVAYGTVVRAMVLLQQAGAPNVGLVTEPPEAASP